MLNTFVMTGFREDLKMTFGNLFRLAGDAIFSFSRFPIRLCLILGTTGTLVFMGAGIWVIISKITGIAIPGWSSTLLSLYFLGSIQLVFLGILGEYIYRNYKESQNRPIYFVRKFYDDAEGNDEEQEIEIFLPIHSQPFFLFIMILMSRDAGISCDDALHYDHSLVVYNYFATHGEDRSALETPVTHLRYYGQSYDNIVTILIKWFGIEDVYRFRHLMSALAGWLTIFITALFGIWLSGYGTGILVLMLFAVSPTFIGHSLNNLKDIPFALTYISGIFLSIEIAYSEKKIVW